MFNHITVKIFFKKNIIIIIIIIISIIIVKTQVSANRPSNITGAQVLSQERKGEDDWKRRLHHNSYSSEIFWNP